MSAQPAAETGAKRRIGDILLAHGFVTPEQIADATAEQERTQQPLGQILVGRGAITRLELASALAEQWSDPAASIASTPPRPAAAPPAAPSAQDEALYAARLQEAVADLGRKVMSNQPLEDIDARVEELSRRIEGTLARTQHIEAAVATLAESLDGVTTGVEEALHALQSGSAELAEDLARIDRSVAELAAHGSGSGSDQPLAELEELRATIADLGAGESDPELSRKVDMLAERLERMESSPVEAALRAELESQSSSLGDLRSAVDALRERPTDAPDVDGRLGSIESRLEAALEKQGDLVEQIGALNERTSAPPEADPRISDVVEQLGALDSRLETALTEMEGVRAHLAEQDEKAADGRLDELARALELVRAEIDGLAAASSQPAEDIAERLHQIDARIDELSRDAPEDGEAAERVAALEERLREGFVTPDELTRSIEWALGERPALETDERVTEALGRIDSLRSELASLGQAAERHQDELARLGALETRISELSVEREARAALTDRLDAMERARAGDLDTLEVLALAIDRMRNELTEKLDGPGAEATTQMAQMAQRIEALEIVNEEARAVVKAPGPDPAELGSELERVRLVLERIGLHLGEHDHALAELSPTRGLHERLDELAALVQSLAASRQSTPDPPRETPTPSPPSTGPDDLLRRVEQAEAASQTDYEKLMKRLERMASSIDWRLQRLETPEPDAETTE